MKLLGRTALVTGAARGIGRGCALELAKAGADVAINDRQPSADTASLIAEIESLGRHAVLVDGDAFERASCEEIVKRTLAALGRIDILVSNPAFSRRGDFLDYDPEIFDKTLRGTLTAGFHMSQFVSRNMVERGGGGKILFISSVHSRRPYARAVAYNAAKAGLNHMAFTIAAELIGHRINVNVIEPGWIDTPGEHETFGDAMIAEEGTKLPWGRIGTPSDIGHAAAFLCSDDADYITGISLVVDGGFCLRDSISSPSMRSPITKSCDTES
ncbi:MAG: SDR family oxidoreductase [Planctomycetaceae bacterium]|nr:SDR family oxidoreductase [Planctomycetaceae bacterium]